MVVVNKESKPVPNEPSESKAKPQAEDLASELVGKVLDAKVTRFLSRSGQSVETKVARVGWPK